ncbi:hypothetical protein [Streptomyces sp. CB03911]|uniref:hypothetical protein n=1 Tax=Streptomyces sp. CB03911 TaxID=1804758 RepID=UPI0018FE4331|nr:hypothetical protein [Streptomyces sp. CB03911]
MNPVRRITALAMLAPAVLLTACEGSGGGGADAAPSTRTGTTGGATAAGSPSTGARSTGPSAAAVPSAVPLPALVDPASLPAGGEARGLVLSQLRNEGKADESCVLVTIGADGPLARVRTFVIGNSTTRPPASFIGCADPAVFTVGFTGMVGIGHYDFKTPVQNGDPHISLLGQGGPTDHKDISGLPAGPGSYQDTPVVDPASGDVVHWNKAKTGGYRLRAVHPDGTGERFLETPAGVKDLNRVVFLGGRMVKSDTAERAVANPDGSLAAFVDDNHKLRVGPVATLETNPVAVSDDGRMLNPKAFVGNNQVLSVSGNEISLATLDVSDPAAPRFTLRGIADVPPALSSARGAQDETFVISRGENAAYTTMDRSADKLGNPRRAVVLRIDLATGALKVVALLKVDGSGFAPLAYVG